MLKGRIPCVYQLILVACIFRGLRDLSGYRAESVIKPGCALISSVSCTQGEDDPRGLRGRRLDRRGVGQRRVRPGRPDGEARRRHAVPQGLRQVPLPRTAGMPECIKTQRELVELVKHDLRNVGTLSKIVKHEFFHV